MSPSLRTSARYGPSVCLCIDAELDGAQEPRFIFIASILTSSAAGIYRKQGRRDFGQLGNREVSLPPYQGARSRVPGIAAQILLGSAFVVTGDYRSRIERVFVLHLTI